MAEFSELLNFRVVSRSLEHLHVVLRDMQPHALKWLAWLFSDLGDIQELRLRRITCELLPLSSVYGDCWDPMRRFLEKSVRIKDRPSDTRTIEKIVFLANAPHTSSTQRTIQNLFGFLNQMSGRQALFIKDRDYFSGRL